MSFVLWIPGAVLLTAAVIDLRSRQIPDAFPLALLAWAVLALAMGWVGLAWWEVPAGAVTGLGIGALLFRLGAMGGGDVKLLVGLGALLGPRAFLVVFLFIALTGGITALLFHLRSKGEQAYAPAIASGYILFLVSAGVSHGSL